jgi:hypothetical protein
MKIPAPPNPTASPDIKRHLRFVRQVQTPAAIETTGKIASVAVRLKPPDKAVARKTWSPTMLPLTRLRNPKHPSPLSQAQLVVSAADRDGFALVGVQVAPSHCHRPSAERVGIHRWPSQ